MTALPLPLVRRCKNLRVRLALLLGSLAPAPCARCLERPVFLVGCARSGTFRPEVQREMVDRLADDLQRRGSAA